MSQERMDITVKIGEKEFKLANDSPDFSEIVKEFAETKNPDLNITVECENQEFDKKALETALKDAFGTFVNRINLDTKKYEEAVASVQFSEASDD